jgi:aspartyl-tRNA(Asn)/glutamyl-tRNA(Gln) amidotransferase subunit A
MLEEAGAVLGESSLPTTEYAVQTHFIISSSEASSNLARYDGIRYGYQNANAKNLEDLYRLSRGRMDSAAGSKCEYSWEPIS